MGRFYDRLARPGSLWFESSCTGVRDNDSLFFLDPVEVLPLHSVSGLKEYVGRLDSYLQCGMCVAGWLGYEAGCGLEPAIHDCLWPELETGLAGWFGVYEQPERFSPAEIAAFFETAAQESFSVTDLVFELTEDEYLDKVVRLKREIEAGNVYQVNFTGRYRFSFRGSPFGLYQAMKRRQPSAYTAWLNTGDRLVLSFSPELFFLQEGRMIETVPMKGTAPRGDNPADDLDRLSSFACCEKNRAENLMIVDLLRNDLGRICTTGSVVASSLFETRTYPTLHQMVSTVRGELNEEVSLYALFRALFPSGSVTGAPKIRAMNLIRGLENSPRGVYTGAVGFMLPEGKKVFNVAIRTVELAGGRGSYGTGSGIVWDSDPWQEYRESLLKAEILSGEAGDLPGLFETILWNGSWLLLDDHLARLTASSSAFGLPFDACAARDMLLHCETKEFRPNGRYRVKLSLDRDKGLSVVHEPFDPAPPDTMVRVCLAFERISSSDRLLHHKTTQRGRYDCALRSAVAAGFDEVLFLNERGEVTEGAISNVVVCRDGRLFTPPEACGLLNGVCRRYLLRTRPWIKEKILTAEDLRQADMLLLCNALRGLRCAEFHATFIDRES